MIRSSHVCMLPLARGSGGREQARGALLHALTHPTRFPLRLGHERTHGSLAIASRTKILASSPASDADDDFYQDKSEYEQYTGFWIEHKVNLCSSCLEIWGQGAGQGEVQLESCLEGFP